MNSEREPVKLFISYSHKDEKYAKQLIKHITVLVRLKIVKHWYDRCIDAGEIWKNRIMEELNDSEVCILIISADFLASKFCYDIEFKHAKDNNKLIIPIIVRSCMWQESLIGNYQALPKGGKAIDKWTNIDEAWTETVKKLHDRILKTVFLTKKELEEKKILKKKEQVARLLEKKIRESLSNQKNTQQSFFFYVDLDKFTQINKRFGEKTGTAIIEAVNEVLNAIKGVHIHRIGDQFFLWYHNPNSCFEKGFIKIISEIILEKIENISLLPQFNNIHISASIGCHAISYKSSKNIIDLFDDKKINTLMMKCIENCRRVKFNGGNDYCFKDYIEKTPFPLSSNQYEEDNWMNYYS